MARSPAGYYREGKKTKPRFAKTTRQQVGHPSSTRMDMEDRALEEQRSRDLRSNLDLDRDELHATKRLDVYDDGRHAWAKVPRSELERLGIADQISRYSYQKGDYVYLEEDSDLPKYTKALEGEDIKVTYKEHIRDTESPIRRYAPYSSKGSSSEVFTGPAEAGGVRVYFASNGKLIKSEWFKNADEARNTETEWKRVSDGRGLEVVTGTAENKGFRSYIQEKPDAEGRTRIVKTEWFPDEAAARSTAKNWERWYDLKPGQAQIPSEKATIYRDQARAKAADRQTMTELLAEGYTPSG
jgi:hypothetical protein